MCSCMSMGGSLCPHNGISPIQPAHAALYARFPASRVISADDLNVPEGGALVPGGALACSTCAWVGCAPCSCGKVHVLGLCDSAAQGQDARSSAQDAGQGRSVDRGSIPPAQRPQRAKGTEQMVGSGGGQGQGGHAGPHSGGRGDGAEADSSPDALPAVGRKGAAARQEGTVALECCGGQALCCDVVG